MLQTVLPATRKSRRSQECAFNRPGIFCTGKGLSGVLGLTQMMSQEFSRRDCSLLTTCSVHGRRKRVLRVCIVARSQWRDKSGLANLRGPRKNCRKIKKICMQTGATTFRVASAMAGNVCTVGVRVPFARI